MKPVLVLSAVFLIAPLVTGAEESLPDSTSRLPVIAGGVLPDSAKQASFVPVHVQIGPDSVERTLPINLSLSLPAAAAVAKTSPAPPTPPSWPDTVFGTWFDLQPALQHEGISPSVTFVSDLAGNPIGGKRQGFTEADNLGLDIAFDLERLCGLRGARADVSMSNRSGSSLTNVYLDNLFQVQQVFGGTTYRFVNFYFEQSWRDDRFNLRVGRVCAGDEFLTSPIYALFMQNGINGNPVGILFDTAGFTVYPVASWGARFRYRPVEEVYVMTGLFDGNPNVDLNEMHGFDFTLHGPLFWMTEVGYQFNGRKQATGLPGNYKAGIWYNDGSFADFKPGFGGGAPAARKLRYDRPERRTRAANTTWGNWGGYLLMDQMIWRNGGPGSKQSINMFGAFEVAPDYQIDAMPYFADAGIVFRGPFRTRPLDFAGFEIGCGTCSPDLRRAQRVNQAFNPQSPVQSYEMILEWTYSVHIRHGVQVQPDLQYIINPGAAGAYPNALVVGVQLSVNF